MSIKRLAWMTLAVIVLLGIAPIAVVQANAPAPRAILAFEFVDENSQPVTPVSLQLERCSDRTCQPIFLELKMGTCSLPACVEGVQADVVTSTFKCITNFCYGEVDSWADWYSRQLVLVPQSDVPLNHALVGIVPKLAETLNYGSVAGWRVLVTPDELVITADAAVTARASAFGSANSICSAPPSPAMIGFAITQIAELLVVSLLLLLLDVPRRSIGGTLMAVGLINFATYPVVWFTFPALGPFRTAHEQAVAVFTLLAAMLYAGLLVRLRPAYNPARRSIFVGLLTVGLPMATVLIFGAATAVSAAIDLAGAGSAAASGAGLPYYVTMPASEVFAFTAEALLIAAICRPVVTAKQAVLLSVLANSASLLLGLVLL